MKVAVVTNNGETISQHFGRSRYFKIFTIENNEIQNVEIRERKVGHFAHGTHHHAEHTSHHDHSHAGHGFGPEAQKRHAMMAREIADCDVLIAGGMGLGAYQSLKATRLEVILTDVRNIEEALTAFKEGKLQNLVGEKTH